MSSNIAKLRSPNGRLDPPTPSQNETTVLEKDEVAIKDDGPSQSMSDERNCRKFENVVTRETIPAALRTMEYAVRGPIVACAQKIKRELTSTPQRYPFTEVIEANIGNPQAVGQQPITFYRQVLGCLVNPALCLLPSSPDGHHSSGEQRAAEANQLEASSNPTQLPQDVVARAKQFIAAFPSFGAYSPSPGVPFFRQEIADWFERRDGFPCDPNSVFLTDGATSGIRLCLELLIRGSTDAILIPVPQYPLYTALIEKLGGQVVPYYLNEDTGWSLEEDEVQRALSSARQHGLSVRAIVVINPGNPTGAVLKYDMIEKLIRFCGRQRLVLLADEVYQDNVYFSKKSFVPFRKVHKQLKSCVELVSFHSCSKSIGEGGVRGGFVQFENFTADALRIINKMVSVIICSNTLGQAMTALMVHPPSPGDSSFLLWQQETAAFKGSLRRKAQLAFETLNRIPKMSCQPIEGAMYAFPRLYFSPTAMRAAQAREMAPDMLYCIELLETTGIACVPGSGFRQRDGTYHFRLTILPPEAKFVKMLKDIQVFHEEFMRRYA